MLYLATGTPGAKKTVFVVSKLDKVERDNKVNLVKNKEYYAYNKKLIDKFRSDFGYYESDVGSGHRLKNVIDVLPDDYFDMFADDFDDLRPDDYFLRATRFNEICERINEREGEQKFKFLLPVRTIYTNIKALKIDYVRDIEYDWRDCPDGSIVVIDEVQLVEPFDQTKNKNDPIIQELTIHRHRGFDFYFITQYPSLLHPTVKDLVGVHYHLTVPYGLKTRVYQFGSTRAYPNTMANKFNCETKFYFSPPDRLFKLYKSTTINTHQKRIPYKQLFGFGILILLGVSVFLFSVFGAKDSAIFGGDSKKPAALAAAAPVVDNPMPTATTGQPDTLTPAPVTGQPDTLAPAPVTASSGIYDPLSGGYIDDINLVPVSGMQMNGRCSVYNADGALLTHISNADCNAYLSVKGMMPKVKSSAPKLSASTAVSPASS
ncbi:zonular occludens toxin domain-containing protein [Psychrobacter celer]|uniref:zonular occludens toxin domain-containing protein n=1 Tax=Psychrobacter celer TaxID=306572 RepID=UPI003FD520EB